MLTRRRRVVDVGMRGLDGGRRKNRINASAHARHTPFYALSYGMAFARRRRTRGAAKILPVGAHSGAAKCRQRQQMRGKSVSSVNSAEGQ